MDQENNYVPEEIIQKALGTYIRAGTRYLKTAQIYNNGDAVRLTADFSIGQCCYAVPNSGHFNAIESLMCLNQMFYVAWLSGIDKKYFSFCDGKVFDDYDNYYPKVYILAGEFRFRELVDGSSFYGEIDLIPLRRTKENDKMYCRGSAGFGNDKNYESFTYKNLSCFVPITVKNSSQIVN